MGSARDKNLIQLVVKYGGEQAAEEYCSLHDAENEFNALRNDHPYRGLDLAQRVEMAIERKEGRLETAVTALARLERKEMTVLDYPLLGAKIAYKAFKGLLKKITFPFLPQRIRERFEPVEKDSAKDFYYRTSSFLIDMVPVYTGIYMLTGSVVATNYLAMWPSILIALQKLFPKKHSGPLISEGIYLTYEGISKTLSWTGKALSSYAQQEVRGYLEEKSQKLLPPKSE